MKIISIAPVLILQVFLFSMHATPSLLASSDQRCDDEIAAAFKIGNYTCVVDMYEKSKRAGDDAVLLAAVSYEKTGELEEARRMYKTLYKKDRDLRLFTGYLLAKSYELSAEYQEAVHRYRKLLSYIKRKKNYDFDTVVLMNAVIFRLYGLREHYLPAERLLYLTAKYDATARCLEALASQTDGNAEHAAQVYKDILMDTEGPYQVFVLMNIARDRRVVAALLGMELEETELIRLYIGNGMYDEAIEVSYLVPAEDRVLLQRAESFMKKGLYEAAIPIFKKTCESNGSPDLLYRLALAYFKAGNTGAAREYFGRYLQASTDYGTLPAEAAYLRLLLQKKLSAPERYLASVSQFIETYRDYPDLDALIYRNFYFTLQEYGTDRALAFLEEYSTDLNGSNYRAWAYYIFGLFGDRSCFQDTVLEYPGSYYYFKAASYLKEKPQAARYNGKTKALLQDSQKLFDEGNYEAALQTLIRLYSQGEAELEVRKRILDILDSTRSKSNKGEIGYSIDYLNSGMFFRLFELGLYDDFLEMFGIVYPLTDRSVRYKLNYLLSRIYYEKGDVYRGVAYAQRMTEYINRDNLIFMDDDVRKLFYPLVYEDSIVKALEPSNERIDRNFLLAIIREESRYKPDALSVKGAAGLMQLMPSTASWIMHTPVDTQDLFDPLFNIQSGTAYLRYLFDRFESIEEVLAAYNGGPNNVYKWALPDGSIDVMVEDIPFSETRDFVKKVYTSYKMYENIYGNGD